MTTYPEMNEKIVEMLSFRGDLTSLYAAGRIEELEAQVTRLLGRVQRMEDAMQEASGYTEWAVRMERFCAGLCTGKER